MTDEDCACCGTVDDLSVRTERETESTVDRWLGETAVMETPLPDDVRTAMDRFLGDASITTLEEWVSELRERTGDGSIGVDDLCHADGETPHRGKLDGDRSHFRCFYDAVALAELASEPVEIHTESPDGTIIEARATGDGDATATPSTAVVSFGIATAESAFDGNPTLEDAYEQWAARTSAATVGVPLSAATAVATGLAAE